MRTVNVPQGQEGEKHGVDDWLRENGGTYLGVLNRLLSTAELVNDDENSTEAEEPGDHDSKLTGMAIGHGEDSDDAPR